MIITKKALDRRTFLRGIGTAWRCRLLDSMVPAHGRDRPRRQAAVRLAFVYVPNGIIQKDWLPKTDGDRTSNSCATMKPLEPFRDKILVLSNLAQINGRALGDGAGDHARAGATWLTGVHPKKTEGADIHAGISADQIAAQELGKRPSSARSKSASKSRTSPAAAIPAIAARTPTPSPGAAPTTPIPMEINPRAVFERLFGDGETTDAACAPEAHARRTRSILDYVRAMSRA